MATYDGKVTVDMDIHVVKDWHECHAEAVLDRGEKDNVQAAGSASVRYSPEHERYLVNLSWGDFWFFPTWDLALARFLEQIGDRVRALGREYHDRSRVKLMEEPVPASRKRRR